jgi:hypothetical protein
MRGRGTIRHAGRRRKAPVLDGRRQQAREARTPEPESEAKRSGARD